MKKWVFSSLFWLEKAIQIKETIDTEAWVYKQGNKKLAKICIVRRKL